MGLTPYTRAYGNLPLTQITPFTYRDGLTFLQILNEFENWLREIVPEIDGMLKTWHDQYAADHEALENEIIATKDQWQALFDAFMLNIIEELEGLNDQAMANLINNVLSQTRQAIDGLFDEHHDSEFFVDIAEFGAKQDGSDSSAAIIAANAEALARGKKITASGVYTIQKMVIITADCDFSSAQFNCDLEGVAFEVTSVRRKHIFGDIVNTRKLPGGWSSVTNSVGLRVRNCNTSVIEYAFIRNFEHGLSVYGDNGGSAYNTFNCGALWHNKVNLVLETTTNTNTGYSNQNTFLGGRWQHESNDSGVNAPGVKQVWFRGGISPDDGGRSNNNTFIGCSFEGAAPEYTVDFERASQNVLVNCRYEFGNKIRFGSVSRDNNMIGGFGLAEIVKVTEPGATRNRWEAGNEAVRYQVVESLYSSAESAFPYHRINWSRRSMALGNGSTEPREIRAASSAALEVDASWHPMSGGTYDMGTPTTRWRNNFSDTVNVSDRVVFQWRDNHPADTLNTVQLYAIRNSNGSYRLVAKLPDGSTHTIAGSA